MSGNKSSTVQPEISWLNRVKARLTSMAEAVEYSEADELRDKIGRLERRLHALELLVSKSGSANT